jgi:hypothetical protein
LHDVAIPEIQQKLRAQGAILHLNVELSGAAR